MRKVLFALVLSSIIYHLTSNISLAQYGCGTQYGGQCPPAPSILIDKMVGQAIMTKGGVTNVTYVDNLTPSDARFRAGQQVYFKLRVKNTSSVNLINVTVKDYVPSYLQPIEGPGTYDASTQTITFNAGNFVPNEEKIYYLTMQVFPQDRLPADKGLFCLVNRVLASTDQTSDDDTSQLCIEKEVIAVAKVPSAGPEMGFVLLTGELVVLGAGMILRKKSV